MEFEVEFKILNFLKEAVRKNKLNHAYIFYGLDENLKKSICENFSKLILCKTKKENCKVCSSCKKFLSGNHPDFLEIGAEEKLKQSFTVENVRELIKRCFVKPNESLFKIFLLKNVDTLNLNASNALLKILEQPPKNVIFLLTATNKNNVLETIFSRCVSFFVPPINFNECLNYLHSLNVSLNEKELLNIANLTQGDLSLAKFLTTEEGLNVLKASNELLDSFLKKDELIFCSILQKNEKNLDLILKILNCFLLKLLLKFEERNEFKINEIEMLYNIFNFLEESILNLKKNCNISITLSKLCCEIFKN